MTSAAARSSMCSSLGLKRLLSVSTVSDSRGDEELQADRGALPSSSHTSRRGGYPSSSTTPSATAVAVAGSGPDTLAIAAGSVSSSDAAGPTATRPDAPSAGACACAPSLACTRADAAPTSAFTSRSPGPGGSDRLTSDSFVAPRASISSTRSPGFSSASSSASGAPWHPFSAVTQAR